MATPKISLPDASKCLYRCYSSIRIGDINYGGHLGNDRVLSYCHEARLRYLKALGMSEQDFLGAGLIMRDSTVIYRAEGFHEDPLVIDLFAEDFWFYGFSFVYLLTRESDLLEIARVKTGMIYFDNQEKNKIKRDEDVKQLLRRVVAG